MTLAEKAIDLVGVDRDLKEAKARLADIVDRAKNAAIRQHVETGQPIRLRTNDAMRQVIDQLYEAGQKHAASEIYRLTGQVPANLQMAGRDPADVEAILQGHLNAYAKKLNGRVGTIAAQQVGLDIGAGAVTDAAFKLPGALNVASQVVSTGLFAGIGDVYDANSGLFGTWQYSAVMDSGTCEVCSALDGTTYPSWEDAQEDLPDGGPNPDCDGEGRCRCRLVPDAESVNPDEPLAAPPPGVPDTPTADYVLLPDHAQQSIETLTVTQAKDQLKRLQKYVRPLRGHVKAGTRNVHPEKIPALERRIDALKAYIKVGGSGLPEQTVVVRDEVTFGRMLRPLGTSPNEIADVDRLEKLGKDFVTKGGKTREGAKQTIQQELGAVLRQNDDFMRSIRAKVTAPETTGFDRPAVELGTVDPGTVIEMPAYPGYDYRVIGPSTTDADRVVVQIEKITGDNPKGSKVGDRIEIHKGRKALDVKTRVKKAPAVKEPVFKHQFPLDTYRSSDPAEQAVSQLIANWAGSSGAGPWPLAMQRAIADEFNIQKSALQHFVGRSGWDTSAEIYAEHGPALRAFVRAMYDHTQKELAANNIDEVVLWRGQGFLQNEWESGMFDARSVRLQPASSFASNYGTSTSFIRDPPGMIAARVPRERVLGTAQTGFGCLSEFEWVVLGPDAGAMLDTPTIWHTVSREALNAKSRFMQNLRAEFMKRGQTQTVPNEFVKATEVTAKEDDYVYELISDAAGGQPYEVTQWIMEHVSVASSYDDQQFYAAMTDLSNLPSKILDLTHVDTLHVGAADAKLPSLDDLSTLAGKKPTGWTQGTWDDAAGVYDGGVIAINPAAPSTSVSPILHEIGHAIDAVTAQSNSLDFANVYNDLAAAGKLSPYFQTAVGKQELFAEMFAQWFKYPGAHTSFADKYGQAGFKFMQQFVAKALT